MKWKRRGMVFMMNDFKAYLRYYVNSNKPVSYTHLKAGCGSMGGTELSEAVAGPDTESHGTKCKRCLLYTSCMPFLMAHPSGIQPFPLFINKRKSSMFFLR